ncbi:MAG: hypothetical protein JWM10_4865, partial [Myxococcaceae bacterium]|nr:hypothetical protein [Myxococcaceae bacterium]
MRPGPSAPSTLARALAVVALVLLASSLSSCRRARATWHRHSAR